LAKYITNKAVKILEEMLTEELDEEEQATVYYYLFECLNKNTHQAKAAQLYESLYSATPKYAYKVRLEKLK
jgi:hypothetical protein